MRDPVRPNPARRIILKGGDRYGFGIVGKEDLLEGRLQLRTQPGIAVSGTWVALLLGPHGPAEPLTRIRASGEFLALPSLSGRIGGLFPLWCLSGTSFNSHRAPLKHSLGGRLACSHGKYLLYS